MHCYAHMVAGQWLAEANGGGGAAPSPTSTLRLFPIETSFLFAAFLFRATCCAPYSRCIASKSKLLHKKSRGRAAGRKSSSAKKEEAQTKALCCEHFVLQSLSSTSYVGVHKDVRRRSWYVTFEHDVRTRDVRIIL